VKALWLDTPYIFLAVSILPAGWQQQKAW